MSEEAEWNRESNSEAPAPSENVINTLSGASEQDEWLRVGAVEKAKSVIELTQGIAIRDVAEVGCGSGAILAELDYRSFAESYWACEPSRSLYEQLLHKRIPRLRAAVCAPLGSEVFEGRQFDLIILSHVLEHLIDSSELLGSALNRASFVVMEVPIEANLLGNTRAGVRRLLTGKPRTSNQSGHVQFFSLADARKMARWAGAEVLKTRLYSPTLALQMLANKGSAMERLYRKSILMAEGIVGRTAWARLYYGNYALLLRKRTGADIEGWSHRFYAAPGS